MFYGVFKYYFGLDYMNRFASDLLNIETNNYIKYNEQMIFTKEDKIYHNTIKTCHICHKTCVNKVRDHCHKTGKTRGPACKIRNLMYQQRKFIPGIFHNGCGKDINLSI